LVLRRRVETLPLAVTRVLALAGLFFALLSFLPAVPAISGPGVSQDRAPGGGPCAREIKRETQRAEPSAEKKTPAGTPGAGPSADDGTPALAVTTGDAFAPLHRRHDDLCSPGRSPRRVEAAGPARRARPQNPRAPPYLA